MSDNLELMPLNVIDSFEKRGGVMIGDLNFEILCQTARTAHTLKAELDAEKKKVTELCDMALKKGKVVLKIEQVYWTEGLSANVRLERIKDIFDKDLKSPDPHSG